MSLPLDLVKIQSDTLHIDKTGVKFTMDAEASGKRLSINELTIGNNPPQIVYIIRYPRCELPEQVAPELPSVK